MTLGIDERCDDLPLKILHLIETELDTDVHTWPFPQGGDWQKQ